MSRLRVADRVHVLHSFGIAHQPPSFIIPLPGLQIGQLRGGLQTSVQASAGVEVEPAEATTATLTVFENIFLNMTDTLAVLRPGQEEFLREERSQGSAHGVELYLKRKLTRRFGGFISYTLSRSSRSVGSERFPSGFDRTHVGSAAVAYDLGRRWRTGARFILYTGAPSLPSTQGLIPQRREEHPDRVPTFSSARSPARETLGAVQVGMDRLRGGADERNAQQRDHPARRDRPRHRSEHRRGRRVLVMNYRISLSRISALLLVGALLPGCLPESKLPEPGSLLTTASGSPATQNGFSTEDGWAISFDRVLVSAGPMQLDDEGCKKYAEYTEPGYGRVLDVVQPGAQKLSVIYGTGRCAGVDFEVSPPDRRNRPGLWRQ